MMTQARTQTLMLVVTVVLAVTGAKDQLRGRLQGPQGERGASALEWAIIAAIAVGVAGVVGAKVIAAVNTHSAQIK
jgi:Flp pilus assembly pilin Flp